MVQQQAAKLYAPELRDTVFFLYAFASSDAARQISSRLQQSQAVVDNLLHFGQIFFMACGSLPPVGVSTIRCPQHLKTPARCFALRVERIRLAMLDAASERGIKDGVFLELDQLWLTDPRTAFRSVAHHRYELGLMFRHTTLRGVATNLNSGFLYTRTVGPARHFWDQVVNQTNILADGNCTKGGENQLAIMRVLGAVQYGVNVRNSLRVHVDDYYAHVREPWLPTKSHGSPMNTSMKRSETPTPCLATLLLGHVANWGAAYGSKGPPAVLHYKGWPTCPSPEAAARSFLNTASCIASALKATPFGVSSKSNTSSSSPVAARPTGGGMRMALTRLNRISTLECGPT